MNFSVNCILLFGFFTIFAKIKPKIKQKGLKLPFMTYNKV